MSDTNQKEPQVEISAVQLISHERWDVFKRAVSILKDTVPDFDPVDYEIVIRKKS